MSKSKNTFVLACFVASSSLSLPTVVAADGHVEAMIGQWESISCEVRPQPQADGTMGEWWLTREVTITEGRIDAQFTTYGAPGCQFPVNVLSFGGEVAVVGDSDVVDGAVEANLTIDDYVQITALAEPFVEFLNGSADGDCGTESWEVGATQDILETGCSFLGVEANTPTVEYEILAAIGDQLYFGARPVDGTFITSADKRPGALLVPLSRAN